jgi:hypothetical protein
MNYNGGNMGDLDFRYEKYHLRRIRETLKRRNLLMNPENDGWQIHGPHEDMNYQVYEGRAYTRKEDVNSYNQGFDVVIFPKAVYEINSSWHHVSPEDRIPVGWKLPEC